MKKVPSPIKVKEALKILKREWPECPESFIRQGMNTYEETGGAEGIKFSKSSFGARAHRFVLIEDVFSYWNRTRQLAA